MIARSCHRSKKHNISSVTSKSRAETRSFYLHLYANFCAAEHIYQKKCVSLLWITYRQRNSQPCVTTATSTAPDGPGIGGVGRKIWFGPILDLFIVSTVFSGGETCPGAFMIMCATTLRARHFSITLRKSHTLLSFTREKMNTHL